MLVLVTGSTGFVGSQIVRALLKQGKRVRAFHRPGSPLEALNGLDVEHALGDLTLPGTLQKAMEGVKVVFHTAAKVGRRSEGDINAITVGGTRNLLEAAMAAKVQRVVHTSSVAALGVPDYLPPPDGAAAPTAYPLMNENHTWNYRPDWWPYGYAKYGAELEVQKAVAKGLDVVIVNPAVVVGAGDLNRISGDVVVRVALSQVPVSTGGGINVVHIDDVVDGHLAVLERGKTGERYILGGENITIQRFLEMIAGISGGRSPLLAVPQRVTRVLSRPVTALQRWLPLPIGGELLRMAGYYFYYDTLKAQVELGLKGTKTARQAVAEAYTWYREKGIV